MWGEIYKAAFPDMVAMIDQRHDGWHQRAGIDRQIVLKSTKVISVDEKVRAKDYGDFALEFLSDERRKTPGWVCKSLIADYIAYAVIPIGKCFLLPVLQLQSAWRKYAGIWTKKYKCRKAVNEDWVTWFCCVPYDTVYSAISDCCCVNFQTQNKFDF